MERKPWKRRFGFSRAGFLATLVVFLTASAGMAQQENAMTRWQEVDSLVDAQKYEAAAKLTAELLEQAQAAGDEPTWTRALIKSTQLRLALHGYAKSVRFLQDQPWPETPRHRLSVGLFYGHTLSSYLRAYSWQIRQREAMAGDAGQDLEKWTLERLVREIEDTYGEVFRHRGAWGEASLGENAAYLDPGTYPPQVRGTLRDTVSYLWVGLLADTGLWRPEASSETYRLDLDALLAPAAPFVVAAEDGASIFADDAHPVEKIRAVLADLEAWHLAGHRPEAALEARLELLRRLRGSFSEHAEDRGRLRSNLEERLATFDRGLPWFSMGLAELADMLRAESEDPMAYSRARDMARQGQRAHPESVGGQRCAHLAASLEQPQMGLAAMAVDGDRKRSIEITHANVEQIHLRAYPVNLLQHLKGKNPRWRPDHQEVERLVATKPVAEWTQALPPTPDLRSHRTFTTPPSLPPGPYVVVASLRRDFKGPSNARAAALFIRSELVLTSQNQPSDGREAGPQLELRTLNGPDGRGRAADVEVLRLDWRSGAQTLARQKTGADGRLVLDTADWGRQRHVVIARDGGDIALLEIFGSSTPRSDTSTRWSLIYTDRSVYRPGQEILFKVIAYEGGGESFQTVPKTSVEVVLNDANGEEVARQKLQTNEFGSASGRFTAVPGRLLGSWSIDAEPWNGWAGVLVEEYKRPTFEVEITEPEGALRLNQRALLVGRADYYFGLPVSAGTASWRVTREPRFPPWRWWSLPSTGSSRVIAHGESPLRPDGTFEVDFIPEADERLAGQRDVTYSYRMEAEVTDEGGETREASRAVIIGFAAIDATLVAVDEFFDADRPVAFDLERRRLAGPPAAGAASYRVVHLKEPETTPLPSEFPANPDGRPEDAFRTAGDRQRPRWETETAVAGLLRHLAEGEEVAAGELEHGADGRARLEFNVPGGAYRLHYRSEDDFGEEVERQQDFVVYGAAPLRLPLVLRPRSSKVEVGETLALIVHSGFADQPMVLEVHQGHRRLLRRELDASKHPQRIEMPVTAAERGGFGVTLTALRDHQLMRETLAIEVPWSDRRLDVSFERFRDRLRPGSEETFSVVVRGAAGEDVALDPDTVELLAYMYDRSLDLFGRHSPPDPLQSYPYRVALPGVRSTLGQGPVVWRSFSLPRPPVSPGLRTASLRYFDGWPIGGPGQRRRGLQSMKARAMAAPAPQATSEAIAADSVTVDLEGQSAGLQVAALAEGLFMEAEESPESPAGAFSVRSDFSETAFWRPHLRLGDDGAARFEFTVPDSVTEWSVWTHALTRDLRSGSVTETTRSVKDLLVRPYLPRFLRAGDRAELRVVISNAGDAAFSGSAEVSITDPETGEDLLALFGLTPAQASGLAFEVEPGKTAALTVPLVAPASPRAISITASARAGELTDGERRPLPILPSRLHLAQSRFAAVSGPGSRTLRFEDLARGDDPSLESESLVLTLDGQLFGSALRALPYLVDYPYQCTEQTLNRYLSTGILSSLYAENPGAAALGARLAAARTSLLEPWRQDDPNRRLLLEETPWLAHARGGGEPEGLLKVLDPEVASQVRGQAIGELRKIQTASGGFPWWPGGPPSPYMTLYALQGFARGLEFGLDVPKDVTVSAWRYLEGYWQKELLPQLETSSDCCAPRLTFFAWLLWAYPDASWTGDVFSDEDRRLILDRAALRWKELSPRLKGYLALALMRSGDAERAAAVWDSVMDSAKTDQDLGTYWAPEDQAWLWYNDTVESQAFALRVLMELDPDDARRHGLVQWLLLDKKLGHWKSTRATAEAVYSLAAYMRAEGTLGAEQRAQVTLGPVREIYVFKPEQDGRRQLVIAGPEVEESMAEIEIDNETKGLLFASATWHFATDRLPEEARGDFFSVERSFFRRELDGDRWRLVPLADGETIAVGDQVEVQLQIRASHAAEYVQLRDPRGAGFEPEDTSSGYAWDSGLGHYREIRDSAVNYFFEWLPAGKYSFRYRLRASTAGTFRIGPAQLQSMYAPEFVAYSSGRRLGIGE